MFWENYLSLCKKENMSPTKLAKSLGISSGTVTGWKNGTIPSEYNLQKIADYFGLSVWDLLSKTQDESARQGARTPVEIRSDIRDDYAYRILMDAAGDATEADLLEAAALIKRRKEERNK